MERALPISFQQQLTSAWCWAAVASMVSDWYSRAGGGQSLSQCGVANSTLNTPCCTPSGINPSCSKLWGLDQALTTIRHYAGAGSSGGFNVVTNQIDAGRPIGALMKYWSGIFHFVLVSGYSAERQLIVVCDPAGLRPFSTPVASFFGNYNNGAVWSGWYFTQ